MNDVPVIRLAEYVAPRRTKVRYVPADTLLPHSRPYTIKPGGRWHIFRENVAIRDVAITECGRAIPNHRLHKATFAISADGKLATIAPSGYDKHQKLCKRCFTL